MGHLLLHRGAGQVLGISPGCWFWEKLLMPTSTSFKLSGCQPPIPFLHSLLPSPDMTECV